MKDYKIYTYIALFFCVLFGVLTFITVPKLQKNYAILFLQNISNFLEEEARTISILGNEISSENIPQERFVATLQKSIENTEKNLNFLSIVNWAGNYVCFPNITKVGESASKESLLDTEAEITGKRLYNHFYESENILENRPTYEIIQLVPIPNTDLLIACNINVNNVSEVLEELKSKLYLYFLFIGLVLLLLCLALARFISNYYNKQLQEKVTAFEYNTKNLEKLNDSIAAYQENLVKPTSSLTEINTTTTESTESEASKERILTYVRNELVSIAVNDIAYIYVENTITYIIKKDGKLSTTTDSLDKLYTTLNKKLFFKVNRQFIVAIYAIHKITKFENSKLKVQVQPVSEIDIIIGKNKASAFKQWLDL